jgi:hypothetical protein
MLLIAYNSALDMGSTQTLIGDWTWEKFPSRKVAWAGQVGLTSAKMLQAALAEFGFLTTHAEFPPYFPAILAWTHLKIAIGSHKPVLALVDATILWGHQARGLHWIVVVGILNDTVWFNDPAYGTRSQLPKQTFLEAWRLPPEYKGYEALVPENPLPP